MSETTTLPTVHVHCPCCGESQANVSLQLWNLDAEAFRCEECSEEFSIADLEALMAKWQKLIAWVKAVPTCDE